jgi:hypothetical protein
MTCQNGKFHGITASTVPNGLKSHLAVLHPVLLDGNGRGDRRCVFGVVAARRWRTCAPRRGRRGSVLPISSVMSRPKRVLLGVEQAGHAHQHVGPLRHGRADQVLNATHDARCRRSTSSTLCSSNGGERDRPSPG